MAMAVNKAHLSTCKNQLVSIERLDGNVFQGRVMDVLETIPALILLKPFKNGSPMPNDKYACNIEASDVIEIVASSPPPTPARSASTPTASIKKAKPNAQTEAAAPQKATASKVPGTSKTAKKKQKAATKVAALAATATSIATTSAACETSEQSAQPAEVAVASAPATAACSATSQVRVLKRGDANQLDVAAFSTSCVINESAPSRVKAETLRALAFIPPQVLNGKKTSKIALDNLIAPQSVAVHKSYSATAAANSRNVSTPSAPAPSATVGTRIDVSQLMGAPKVAAAVAAADPSFAESSSHGDKQTEHRVFGDFKQFTAKQVPNLQKVVAPNGSSRATPRSANNGRHNFYGVGSGPCGVPELDTTNGYCQLYADHDELTAPLDLSALTEDFDFGGNLALFHKDDMTETASSVSPSALAADEEEAAAAIAGALKPPPPPGVVYEEKLSTANYRNDENVIRDPQRVTSWVPSWKSPQPKRGAKAATSAAAPPAQAQKRASARKSPSAANAPAEPVALVSDSGDEYNTLSITTQSTVVTMNGGRLPVLKTALKRLYSESATRLYSSHLYDCIAADRYAEFVMGVHRRYNIIAKSMLVIGGPSCSPVQLHRFCQFFVNRACKINLYDPPPMPGNLLTLTNNVTDVDELPRKPRAVYFLDAATFHNDEELRRYILRMSRPSAAGVDGGEAKAFPHLVALDFRLFDVKNMHTLYLGAADETALSQGRQRNASGEACLFDAAVADIGTPYQWIQCANADQATAFSNTMSCQLAT